MVRSPRSRTKETVARAGPSRYSNIQILPACITLVQATQQIESAWLMAGNRQQILSTQVCAALHSPHNNVNSKSPAVIKETATKAVEVETRLQVRGFAMCFHA